MKLSDINNVPFLNNFYKTTCKYIFCDKTQPSPIALILYNHGKHYFVLLSSSDDILMINRLNDEMDLFLQFDMNLMLKGYKCNKEFKITENIDEDILFESNIFSIQKNPYTMEYKIITSAEIYALDILYSLPVIGQDLFDKGGEYESWTKDLLWE